MISLIFFLLHFFQADSPIVISRETTYITEPLRADGLPDYERYMLELDRKGATPENNAAVLMWQALWPQNLESGQYEMMRLELGLKATPSTSTTLQQLHGGRNIDRVKAWILMQRLSTQKIDPHDLIWVATCRAWRSEQFPPLADWLDANKRALDLLVEASRRPRFYSPSPTLLDDKRDPLIDMLLPGSQNMRDAARALGVRAMRHVGENRLPEAWSDLAAIHRLARLTAQGQSVTDQLVAMAMSELACQGTLALLSSDHLTIELARQVTKDLAELSNVTNVLDRINNSERISALDAVFRIKREGMLPFVRDIQALSGNGELAKEENSTNDPTRNLQANWNSALNRVNSWYDRLVTVLRMPSHISRKTAYARFEAELSAEHDRIGSPRRLVAPELSLNPKGESVGVIVASLIIPSLETAIAAEDRTSTMLQLTRLAAALATYRAEHRVYPAKLDGIVPGELSKLPVDIYNSKGFVYRPTSDGYLLYSIGEDGKDDGGDNEQLQLAAGRQLDDLRDPGEQQTRPDIRKDSDDISIRLPREPFTFKFKKPTER